MKIAVIPARGGSKRIPRKNVKAFCGRPMIAWSITAARASGCFDHIVVSTDDAQIAETAVEWGGEAPFLRPARLSDDHTGTTPVVAHAIEALNRLGWVDIDQVCCIYATAPFIRPEDIREGLNLLEGSAARFAFSVTSYAFPIQRSVRITEEGRVEMFYPQHFNTRSQDLEEAWHDAGQFYWGQARAWISGEPLFGRGSIPVILPRYRVQDIDTQEDWERAEWMFKALQAQVDQEH